MSHPPLGILRCLRTLAVALCAVILFPAIPLASGAAGRPSAHARGKVCKPGIRLASAAAAASARRSDARTRASIARYGVQITHLRRAGTAAHGLAIQRYQRRIAGLRSRLACQARFVSANPGGLRIGLVSDSHGWGSHMGVRQDMVAPSGVRNLRELFDWSVIEPARGQYDWSRYDELELTSAQRGYTILPMLMGTPGWTGASGNAIPSDPAAYAEFVAAVVARYGPGGAFWAGHPELAGRAPQYFELWNEPYYPMFSAGRIDPGRYARLVKAAGRAGKAANPQARFIAAAETDVQPRGSRGWVSWTDAMYAAVPDLNAYFDAVAVHPYSKNRPPDARIHGNIHDKFQRIATIHERFRAHGAGDKPLWITEMGWSTCADPSQNCVSEAQQNAYTRKLFAMVRGQYRDFVGAVFLYCLTDYAPAGSSDPEKNFGLMREDGAPKPALTALRDATGA